MARRLYDIIAELADHCRAHELPLPIVVAPPELMQRLTLELSVSEREYRQLRGAVREFTISGLRVIPPQGGQ